MGVYINPIKEAHPCEKWDTILRVAGKRVSREEFARHIPGEDGKFGVCLMDNGAFVAAGVAYSMYEAEGMASLNDGRPLAYCFLTVDQIGLLDPQCRFHLERVVNIQREAVSA